MNALLGPSKRQKRRVCWDPALSDTPSDSDTDLAVPFADDSMEVDEEQDTDFCSVLVVSPNTTMEKIKYDVLNVSDGRTHFLLVWRKILFVSLVRDKHFFSYFVSFVFVFFFL